MGSEKPVKIKVENLSLSFGGIKALDEVTLDIRENEILAIIGPNGAGKTTTIKAISGLIKTEEGEIIGGSIYFDSKRIDRLNPQEIAALGMTQVMEGRRVLAHLTVQENLMIFALRRKDRFQIRKDLEMVFNYFPKIKSLYHRTSGYLSGGEQQMLVIGRASWPSQNLCFLMSPHLGLLL